jgi:crotonobetainyl-CoA:carnitine CoA-transferase CaiB-like acyl-CoA transferase
MRMNPLEVLAGVWRLGQLPTDALAHVVLHGLEPVLPSSFAVGTAAQVPIAAAALAACELGHTRGQARQHVRVDMLHAALECEGWCSIDGQVPKIWDTYSGMYRCADGWVRVHANFAHHRDGALQLLGLRSETAQRADAERALLDWRALDYEQAAAERGLVVAAMRSFEQWDAHPQAQALAGQPLMSFERIGEAPPLSLPGLAADQRPLSGLKVLDLTRILAGPACGRTLAAYGAEVMLINAPHLPNIEAIASTSRGKLSAHVDLRSERGRGDLDALLARTHVFVQGYRPGALEALGYGAHALAERKPGLVYVSLSAYGSEGPWRMRRGFDSLVQTATGFNHAEAEPAGSDRPKPLPMQILDYATGHLMAFAVSAALRRQMEEGGSWHVRLSLAQTGKWIRGLGRLPGGLQAVWPQREPYLETSRSGFGVLVAVRHSAELSRTPARWSRPAVSPGTDAPAWT